MELTAAAHNQGGILVWGALWWSEPEQQMMDMMVMMAVRQENQHLSSSSSFMVMTIIWMLWRPGSVDPPTSGPSAPNDSRPMWTHWRLQRLSSTSIDQSQLREEDEEEEQEVCRE